MTLNANQEHQAAVITINNTTQAGVRFSLNKEFRRFYFHEIITKTRLDDFCNEIVKVNFAYQDGNIIDVEGLLCNLDLKGDDEVSEWSDELNDFITIREPSVFLFEGELQLVSTCNAVI